ncbi:MAG: Calcineurin-like phosphoesterase [Candidatus Methanolliviera sp. GoM_oil]|nr:MAG: Calcineurin-like phosphoesterase [Candidatus Methanolliviera sp. GoM_oil]
MHTIHSRGCSQHREILLTSIKPRLFPADMGLGSEQCRWLEDDRSNVPDDVWKVIVLHRPPYSCGKVHGDQTDIQPITELFDKYNVDLVFCGHEHRYERSKPMYRGKVSEEGTIYIISAGAGAPLYPLNEEDKRFLYAESCYNYVLVKVGGDTLTLKAKYPDGEAFDSLTLKKPRRLNIGIRLHTEEGYE